MEARDGPLYQSAALAGWLDKARQGYGITPTVAGMWELPLNDAERTA